MPVIAAWAQTGKEITFPFICSVILDFLAGKLYAAELSHVFGDICLHWNRSFYSSF